MNPAESERPRDPQLNSGDVIAALRAFFPAMALLVMLLPVPYAQLDDPWREPTTLTFWETVAKRPKEIHWLWLPVTLLALIGWERFETHHLQRIHQPSWVAGAIMRLMVFLFVVMGLGAYSFNLDLFGVWSMSVGNVVLVIGGLSMLVGIVVEIVVAAGRRGSRRED